MVPTPIHKLHKIEILWGNFFGQSSKRDENCLLRSINIACSPMSANLHQALLFSFWMTSGSTPVLSFGGNLLSVWGWTAILKKLIIRTHFTSLIALLVSFLWYARRSMTKRELFNAIPGWECQKEMFMIHHGICRTNCIVSTIQVMNKCWFVPFASYHQPLQ